MLAENDLKSERTKHSHARTDTEYLRVSAAARQRRRRGASRRRGGSACRRRREKRRTTGGGTAPRRPAPPRGEHADADAWRVAAGWLAGGGSEGERASKRRWSSCRGFFLGWAAGVQLGCWRVEWPARRGVKRGWTAMGRVHARLIKAE